MSEVFEDVVSADEFSDVGDECDDRQAPLSNDDIAHMLGLMGGGGGRPTAPTALATAPVPPLPPSQQPHMSAETKKAESLKARIQEPAPPPRPDVSDFDRFLADFTQQQQVVRSSKVSTTTSQPRSSQPTSAGHGGQPGPPPVTAPLVSSVSTPPREQDRNVTAFEALLSKTVASVESSAKSVNPAPTKWGVFTPDKMPPRLEFESLRGAKSPLSSSNRVSPKRLKVIVPGVAYLRAKNVRIQRTYDSSASKELTFRPTINTSYYRRRGMARLRGKTTLRFAVRMQQDISERMERHRRRETERQKREERDARMLRERRRSLVTKGSKDILERNGLWEEPLEDRLERLLKRSSRQPTKVPSSVATRCKRDKLREKEAAKARTCESLYRRGVDKLQRAREEPTSTSFASPDRRSSLRSESIVRERLDRDVRMICGHDSVPENNHGEGPASPLPALPSNVSFVEFSCVLLYFGFVPAPNTPWEGDAQVSLLWHTWVTYAEGDGDARRVRMSVLKHLLESVIVKHNYSPGSTVREPNQGQKARLLEIFRLNYIARKRPRGVSGKPENGTKRNDNKRHPRKSAPVVYTIHGKAVAPSEKPCDLLEVRHSLAQQRIEAMRREKAQEELAECTFKPRISSTSAKESLGGYKFKEADDASISTEPEAFDRLYSDAFVRQNNSMAQYMRARREQEEKCKKEMHVSPTCVNGLTVEERLERLHESLSNNALPVHFYEKIAEMRHAYASKIEDAREKASRLETAHVFPRSKDGHTIIVPFQFATQQRTKENRRKGLSTSNRHHYDSEGSLTTTSAILREMRLHYAPHIDATSTGCVGADEGVEDDVSAADLCIDVHVSPFETYQLCLNRSDDVYAATKAFADAHNLDANQQKQLLRHAEAKLEELFDL